MTYPLHFTGRADLEATKRAIEKPHGSYTKDTYIRLVAIGHAIASGGQS